MFNKIAKLITLSGLCLQLTACPTGGGVSEVGPPGLPGKDVTEVADGTIDLSKLKSVLSDAGKFLSIENGVVVPKDVVPGDDPGTILYKNAAGSVVAKTPLGVGQVVTSNGHILGNITSPQYLSAYGALDSGMGNLYLIFAGAGCTGEARFAAGDSNGSGMWNLIGVLKSISAGPANETFYEVDTASGIQTDTFTAMSHASNWACTESGVGGMPHVRTLKAILYPTNPINELGIVSAEVK